jgi:magnesium-transporting ATPase (P-type)
MVFAKCMVSGQDLGDFRRGSSLAKDEVAPGVAKAREILSSDENVMHFFTCLALCHAVQPTPSLTGITYAGMSPDEIAFVEVARDVGIVLESRDQAPGVHSVLVVKGLPVKEDRVTIRQEIEFNADRKRMSVLLEWGDEFMCITKGADSAMEPLLTQPYSESDNQAITDFSKMGLRTLVVGSRKLSKEDYLKWETQYLKAQAILDDTRNEEVEKCVVEMEIGLTFCGITAVEDRLQDGVPQAIAQIKAAGIKVWVLTGDKVETAVDIARSCTLFTESTNIAYATHATSVAEVSQMLSKAKTTLADAAIGGLVLDGPSVQHALSDDDCQALILELGLQCQSCVCCRLSPAQKRQLVELVRSRDKYKVTLSIGDGANDVPMLEGAHIGIGVRGKEGAQAVQVATLPNFTRGPTDCIIL